MRQSLGNRSRTRSIELLGLIACTAFLAAGLPATAEETAQPGAGKVRWLAEHAVSVQAAPPAAEDFSDLMPLVRWIGTSRVVALGEATHGDGAAFLAKARLVRFLHETMGFDVLAWESGFFDVAQMDTALRGDLPLQEAAARGLYQIWWQSTEVQPVLAYVRSTQKSDHPILSAGFDCRIAKDESRLKLFPAFIFDFFDRLDPALISRQERADLTAMSVGLVPKDVYEHPGERLYNRALPLRLIAVIDQRRPDLLVRASPREIDFVRQSLVSFLAMDRALGGQAGTGKSTDGYTRDTAMAENLLWLLQGPLAGRKVIVWAHNFHILRSLGAPSPADSPPGQDHSLAGPMGLHLARALGPDYYAIGFLAYHGRYGYAGEEPVDLPALDAASLEGLLDAVGKPQLLLSLRDLPADHWLRSRLASGYYFHDPQETEISRLYDAVFFIDAMTPSHALGTP